MRVDADEQVISMPLEDYSAFIEDRADTERELLDALDYMRLKARRNRRYGNFATVVAAVLLVAALAGWVKVWWR